jgi:predicted transport protein
MRKPANRRKRRHASASEAPAEASARHVHHRNVVGKIINFRGLVYSPVNENGVIFLFGKIAADLNMYVETIRPGYPDCIAKRYIGKGKWEDVRIEFEFRSADFTRHRHHPDDCDAIVCWEDDWTDRPKRIEVIELRSIVEELPNPVLEEPDKVSELSEHNIDDLFKGKNVRAIYDDLHRHIAKIDGEVWRKVGERTITYYSPDRVFAYVKVQKQGLRLTVFTNGKPLQAVEQIDYERGGEKWGHLFVKSKSDLKSAIRALRGSHGRLVEAIKRGENTGWYAEQG